jgi:hypothetical protein
MVRTASLLREDLRPGILRVIKYKRDELNQRFFGSVARRVGLADGRRPRAASTAKQREEILPEDEAQHQQDERAANSEVHPAELKPSASTAGIVTAIFDVLAFSTGCPAHVVLLDAGKQEW